MKWCVALFIVFSFPALAGSRQFKLDDPPFYTMTFEEIQDVPANLKDKYLKEVLQLLRMLKPRPGQKVTGIASLDSLEELTRNGNGWNKLREETFNTCQMAPNKMVCGDLLNARRQIFYTNAGSHDGTYGSGERR